MAFNSKAVSYEDINVFHFFEGPNMPPFFNMAQYPEKTKMFPKTTKGIES